MKAIKRVLVGLDGSEDAARAAEFAATLCSLLDAEAIGIHALGLLETFGDGRPGKHLAAGRRVLAEANLEGPWSRPFRAAGVRHGVELRDGNPVDVLLRAAAELGADLLVVGSKGTGDLDERLMGSTSTQITERATVPVVVVPGHHAGRSPEAWRRASAFPTDSSEIGFLDEETVPDGRRTC